MTDHIPSHSAPRTAGPKPSLYRYVVSLGMAAIVATWLPFSFLYINALERRPVAAIAAPAANATSAMSPAHTATLASVTTRTS